MAAADSRPESVPISLSRGGPAYPGSEELDPEIWDWQDIWQEILDENG